MLLQTRDGIKCDMCGMSHRKQFTYYSMDYSVVHITTDPYTVRVNTSGSNDICDKCFNQLVEKCKKHIRPTKPKSLKCDLCPSYMSGNINIVKAIFAKVVVDSSAKAEGPAEIQHKCMNFDICEKCWTAITNSIAKVNQSIKQTGNWS